MRFPGLVVAVLVVLSTATVGFTLADPRLTTGSSTVPVQAGPVSPDAPVVTVRAAVRRLNGRSYRATQWTAVEEGDERRWRQVFRRTVDTRHNRVRQRYTVGDSTYESFATPDAVWVRRVPDGEWRPPTRGGSRFIDAAVFNLFATNRLYGASGRVLNRTADSLTIEVDAPLLEVGPRDGRTVCRIDRETGVVTNATVYGTDDATGNASARVRLDRIGRARVDRPDEIGFSVRELLADLTRYTP